MNIAQLKQVVGRYLRGKANDQENRLIDEWAQQAAADATDIDAGESNRRRAMVLLHLQEHLQQLGDHTTTPVRRLWSKKSGIAAAACLLLVAGSGITYIYRYALQDAIDPIPLQAFTARPFQVKRIVLPDSSVAVLNGNTTLSYPQRFRGPDRTVMVRGEAYFEIRKNAAKPFKVQAAGLQVQVLGTSFVVSNDTTSQTARVGVATGKVAVSYAGEGFPNTILTPNQQLSYDKQQHRLSLMKGGEVNIDWTNKQLIFKAATLQDVFAEVAGTFGVPIQLAPALQQTLFTGSFDTSDSLQDVLKVLSLSYNLKIQKNKDGTIAVSEQL